MSESDVVAELDRWLVGVEPTTPYAPPVLQPVLRRARDEIVALRSGLDAQIVARKAAEADADTFMASNGALTDEVLALRKLVSKLGDERTIATKLIRAEALEEAAGRCDDLPISMTPEDCAAAIRALKDKSE